MRRQQYLAVTLSGLAAIGASVALFRTTPVVAQTHNWGFFSFGHQAPPYQPTASVTSAGECAACYFDNCVGIHRG
jgi:hypothetical protein